MIKKRVTDLITIDMVRAWSNNIYTITAGTGTGKSYFIKNIVYLVAEEKFERILFLVHRINCKNQFLDEIKKDKKTDTITIKTYQYLEQINDIDNYLKQFDYIVSDEFHYWISDAAFNPKTEISFNAILNANHAKRIFMSATSNNISRFINGYKKIKTIDYKLDIEYNFNDISFFHNDKTIEKLIQTFIKNKQKAIFFIQSAEKAYNLYNKYKEHCIFNCSKNNNEYYQYVNGTKIETILNNEGFKQENGIEETILITTTCLDAGVNIIDTDLHYIVCDVKDYDTLIQCIGRKRIKNNEDYLNVYVKNISNQQLGGLITKTRKKVEQARYLKNHTIKEYLQEYKRQSDINNIIYNDILEDNNCILKVNELMYIKNTLDIFQFEVMLNKGKYGYCEFLKELLNLKSYKFIDTKDNDSNDEELKDFLNYYVENEIVMLTREDRKELIEKINVKSNGKLLKGINILNGALKEREINNYVIIEFETTRRINNKKNKYKNAWKVMQVEKYNNL